MDQAVGGDAYKIFNAITGILVIIRVQMANTRWRGANAQVATMSGRWQAAVLEATNFAKHAETASLQTPTDTALPNDLSVNVIHLGRSWRCPNFHRQRVYACVCACVYAHTFNCQYGSIGNVCMCVCVCVYVHTFTCKI